MRNWFSGKTAVPYAAHRLIRILARYELPGDAWAGWLMHSGKLWTPEGHPITPADGGWWSLLVRQARMFRTQYCANVQLRDQLQQIKDAGFASLPPPAQPGAQGRETAGLVSFKTSRYLQTTRQTENDANLISECYHSASWPQPFDSAPPSKPEQSSTLPTWASPSMPWWPSPSMPTYGLAPAPRPNRPDLANPGQPTPPRSSGPYRLPIPERPPASPPNPARSLGVDPLPALAGREAARTADLLTEWGGL